MLWVESTHTILDAVQILFLAIIMIIKTMMDIFMDKVYAYGKGPLGDIVMEWLQDTGSQKNVE